MILIRKNDAELKTLAIEHYKNLIAEPFKISERISVLLSDKKLKAQERALFDFIYNSLRALVISTPYDLKKLNNKIQPLYQSYISVKTNGLSGKKRKAAIAKANSRIFSIFCYDEFVQRSDGKFAYNFTEKLDVNVCVYCNRQYTFTLWSSDGKCRPTLDHFFDKAKHPYFALSFYNLIPSCYTCNSSLKNQKEFHTDTHLHPYVESMLEVLEFKIEPTNVGFIDGNLDSFQVKLKPNKSCNDSNLVARAQNNAKTFKIEELYNGHKDYAAEIIKKAYYYSKEKIDELYNFKTSSGKKLFTSKEEVVEFALGNFINDNKLGKRVLSKLTKDLATDLGLLKYIK